MTDTATLIPKPPRKLFVKTYGCQMNVYDSARMADVLAPHGFGPTDTAEDADMVILNTCHIREKAAEKVFSELGRLRALKMKRGFLLAVAGCVAQADGEEVMRRAPYVDIVLGPQTYHRLPEMVAKAARGEGQVLDTALSPEPKFDFLPEPKAEGAAAFLSIQEGCDKFCTYCVVPYTRGAEYSRPQDKILAEAEALAGQGVVEITLLGQNVSAWEDQVGLRLAGLIRRLARIGGIERLRYTTSHPADLDMELVDLFGEEPKLMPYLHLPVQAGSDRVLTAMNRGHDREDYFALAERLRRARPGLALSSDFIVGFPGETDADFEETMDLVREVGFVQAYSFKYSARPGTPASSMPGQVAERIKEERLARLQALLSEQTRAFNASCVGTTMAVLFDRPGRHPGQVVGRSPFMQPVHVENGAEFLGRVMPVRITAVHPNSLAGEMAGP